jgi:hypothetical protein
MVCPFISHSMLCKKVVPQGYLWVVKGDFGGRTSCGQPVDFVLS